MAKLSQIPNAAELIDYDGRRRVAGVLDGLESAVMPMDASGLVLVDEDGYEAGSFDRDRVQGMGWALGSDGLQLPQIDVSDSAERNELFDSEGFSVPIRSDVMLLAQERRGVTLLDEDGHEVDLALLSDVPDCAAVRDDYARRDAVNLALSAAPSRAINPNVQRAASRLNLFLTTGQSLSNGMEGWPAKSRDPVAGNYMIGGAVRPNSRMGTAWAPVGAAALNPLKAVVQTVDMDSILTDAQVAALAPGSGNFGESFDVGAVNFFRKCWLNHYGLVTDPARENVVVNVGVDGRTIEDLSKGSSTNLWNRLVTGVAATKAIAQNMGASLSLPAILFAQGEWNYADQGGVQTKLGYKNKVRQYRADIVADACVGALGQAAPPAFITYQTSAGYTVDTNDLAIGQAQLELALEEDNWFLAAPSYPFTDKYGHLTPNGYRWLGMQYGKVMFRVLVLGQDWKPLHIREATITGREIVLDYLVPEPPLAFAMPYIADAAADYADKGYRVLVNGAYAAIESLDLVGQTLVRLRLAAAPPKGAQVKILYASKAGSDGNGCLRDSDPTVAPYQYEYQAGSGDYPSANIPALVGKPYPLHNWACAQAIIAQEI